MKIKISIITVSFNCEKTIKETIKSILNQDYNDYEYIVVDGGSSDNTVQVLKEFYPLFKAKGGNFKWISEKDEGIYDAMNKGIDLASGEWLNFMNAGDTFADQNVLKTAVNRLTMDFVLVYGSKIQHKKIIEPLSLSHLSEGIIMANHQSMFFNKKILGNDLNYDLRYKIYSDYELVDKIYLKYGKEKFYNLHLTIAIYEGGGISETVSFTKRKDKYLILLRHYGLLGVIKGLWYRLMK